MMYLYIRLSRLNVIEPLCVVMSDLDNTLTPQSPNHQDYYEEPLDERLYDPTYEELKFFKQQTGIQDDDELKAHILELQAEAYKVQDIASVRVSGFLRIGKQPNGPIFLDIGSGFGNDARKAVADGYPLENVITSDLHQEFADLGHKLYKTTPEPSPSRAPFTATNAPTGPTPELRGLTSLNPLHGRVTAIHATSFFHLFGEEKQLHLARALAGLLSPEPGSIILVVTLVSLRRALRRWGLDKIILWDGAVFEKGVVKVKTMLMQVEGKDFDGDEATTRSITVLAWSITRL
ncbi:hypothetical protein BJV74DRAFT_985535 [Russula compacta]|nr:hypothetical protein BJV74DRAFT_985535 [Russula compacta]